MSQLTKIKQGGKREGAGRPKKEDTVVMRIPKSLAEKVKQLIHSFQLNQLSLLPNSKIQEKDYGK